MNSPTIDLAMTLIRFLLLLLIASLTLATVTLAQSRPLEIEVIPADAASSIASITCDVPNFTCVLTFTVSANFASSAISLRIPQERDSEIKLNGKTLAIIDYDETGATYTLRANGRAETFRNWDSLSRRFLAILDSLLGVPR